MLQLTCAVIPSPLYPIPPDTGMQPQVVSRITRKHGDLQSPDGITVSGNMAISAAAVGRRQDAMVFLHEAGIHWKMMRLVDIVDKVEVKILWIYCGYHWFLFHVWFYRSFRILLSPIGSWNHAACWRPGRGQRRSRSPGRWGRKGPHSQQHGCSLRRLRPGRIGEGPLGCLGSSWFNPIRNKQGECDCRY